MNDRDLLQRFIDARDPGAFAELVQRHINLVHGIARRSTSSADADDVTQAVFLLLSQKARKVQRQSTLTGWLFRATRYCCLNLQKSQRRRSHYEQQAGGRMQPAPDAIALDLSTDLDAALAQLPTGYRDAVLLRYLEGRSVEETGAALNLSTAAAGKRATRGLELLRAHFAKSGYTLGAAALATTLLAESAKAAPAHLAPAIGTAFSTGAFSGKITLLAKLAGKAFIGLPAKIAAATAATIAVMGITAATFTIAHRNAPPSAPPNVPASATPPVTAIAYAPASAPAPVDEQKILGTLCIASYGVLLDPASADALRKIATPLALPAEATFYRLQRASAQDVRDALQSLRSKNTLIAISSFFNKFAVRVPNMYLSTGADFSNIQRPAGYFNITLQHIETIGPTPATNALQLHFTINQNAEFQWWGAHNAIEKLDIPANLQWTGPLAPGEAFLLFGDFGDWKDDHLVTVSIYEAFKANDYQAGYINHLFDPDNWIQQGPTGARAWADRAWVWGHGDDRPSAEVNKTQAKWSRTLADGAVVTLCGVGRPSRWAFCWWDGDGFPTTKDYWGHQVGLETPLAAAISIHWPDHAPAGIHDWEWSDYALGQAVAVPEDARRVAVYVPASGWTEHAMKRGESIDLGGHLLTLKTTTGGSDSCFATPRGDWAPEYQVAVTAVLKDGTRSEDQNRFSNSDIVAFGGDDSPEKEHNSFFHAALKDVDHFAVMTRQREAVEFEGFAATPTTMPKAPTADKIVTANRLDGQYKDNAAANDREAEWEKTKDKWTQFAAIPRDETTPNGTMRVLLDKALAGDVDGVESRLTGKDAEAVHLMARGITAYEHLWNLGLKKFGDAPVRRAVARQGVEMSLEGEYLGRTWKVEGDRAVDSWGNSQLVRIDGKWRLDVDHGIGEMPKAQLASLVQRMEAEEKKLAGELNSGKIADARSLAMQLSEIMSSINSEAQTQPAR